MHRLLRSREPATLVLAALLLVGLVMRVVLTIQWRPGFVGYSDSGIYFQGAFQSVWADPIRTVGYSVILDAFHAITPHLAPVIFVQHLLGLATGVLLFLTVRRTSAPAWVALPGAAVVLLGGSQLMLEHAALSEGFATPVLALGLYAAVRAPGAALGWALLAGVCLGLGIALKGVGTVVVPVVVACLAFAAGRPTRDSLTVAGLTAACALAVVAGYIGVRQAQTDLTGLTTNGNFNLYGRVAPFAECTKFTPPKGTESLCDATPPEQRPGSEFYIFNGSSPGIKLAGPVYLPSPNPDAMGLLGKYSRAAILGQPGAYLGEVWDDAVRLVDLDHPSHGQIGPDGLRGQLVNGLSDGTPTGNGFVEYWRAQQYPEDDPLAGHGSIGAFVTWDRWSTPRGPLMALVLLLAALAPLLARPGTRRVATLMALTAWVLLLFPIFSKAYDYRFVVPTLGPLVAAATLGAYGLAGRVRERRARGEPQVA